MEWRIRVGGLFEECCCASVNFWGGGGGNEANSFFTVLKEGIAGLMLLENYV